MGFWMWRWGRRGWDWLVKVVGWMDRSIDGWEESEIFWRGYGLGGRVDEIRWGDLKRLMML